MKTENKNSCLEAKSFSVSQNILLALTLSKLCNSFICKVVLVTTSMIRTTPFMLLLNLFYYSLCTNGYETEVDNSLNKDFF